MNNLPYFYLQPYDCKSLTKIRLGNKGDGGYCIPKEILKEIKQLITFGVNDEDSFEIALKSYIGNGQDVKFYLNDPFCEYSARPGNEHFIFKSLGLAKETDDVEKMISWPDFRKILGCQENIFLKVDIEFAEWDSLENLNSEDFEGVDLFVIEFHNLLSRFNEFGGKMRKVLQILKDQYYLYHIHANNNGYNFKNDRIGFLPDVVECTYVKKSWADKKGHIFTKRTEQYPEEIDIPCNEIKFDPIIQWWDSKVVPHLNMGESEDQ